MYLYIFLKLRQLVIDAHLCKSSDTLVFARSQPRQRGLLLRRSARFILSVAGNDVTLRFAESRVTSFESVWM